MQNKANGHQCINCHVDSCAINDGKDCTCTLTSGRAEDTASPVTGAVIACATDPRPS